MKELEFNQGIKYGFLFLQMAGSQLVSCSVSAHTVKADKVFVITELRKHKQNN